MLDLITITVLVLGFLRGYRKGVIVAVFSVIAVLLGILCALKLSHLLAAWLREHGIGGTWAPLVAYVILFVGVGWIVRRGARAIEGLTKAVMLGFVNKLAGGVLYAFISAVVWSSVLWLAARVGVVTPEAAAASKTYAYMEPLAPKVYSGAGTVLPFARDVFGDLSDLFDKAAEPDSQPSPPDQD